jgi:hypothetical protein
VGGGAIFILRDALLGHGGLGLKYQTDRRVSTPSLKKDHIEYVENLSPTPSLPIGRRGEKEKVMACCLETWEFYSKTLNRLKLRVLQ